MSKKQSATRIVQSLLSKHEHLSTQQLFQMSTEDLRPVLRPAHVIDQHGRIRMKRVSNMREGRRPWVPIPTAPFPEHPFQSVNFLKRTILSSLESQGLIHKARIERPLETEQEREEAFKQAMRLTRKDERTALRLQEPVPPPRQPKTTVADYAWKMGRAPERARPWNQGEEEEDDFDEDGERSEKADRELAMRMQNAWAARSTLSVPQPSSNGAEPTLDDITARWDQAARLEESFNRAKDIEAAQIEERQRTRRLAYKMEREQKKAEKREDLLAGRAEAVKAEKKRIEALEAIEGYARQTGEDVSGWYKELGIEQGEDIPLSEAKERRQNRKSGFGLR